MMCYGLLWIISEGAIAKLLNRINPTLKNDVFPSLWIRLNLKAVDISLEKLPLLKELPIDVQELLQPILDAAGVKAWVTLEDLGFGLHEPYRPISMY